MVRITCEMCGSNNLIKQDGEYVCQHCGTKYTTEEAKKLIVEVSGKVDISGSTVKIDNQEQINNYLQNARRVRDHGDWLETDRYYVFLKDNLPDNTEVIIYSDYAKARLSVDGTDKTYRESRLKMFKDDLSIISENYDISNYQENKVFVEKLSEDIITMTSKIFRVEKNEPFNLYQNIYILFAEINKTFIEILGKIAEQYKGNESVKHIYEIIIKHCKFLMDKGYFHNELVPIITAAHYSIKRIDPKYPNLLTKYTKKKLFFL